jgi:hypothetical protein
LLAVPGYSILENCGAGVGGDHAGGIRKLEECREQLGREILKYSCKPHLRQIVVRISMRRNRL